LKISKIKLIKIKKIFNNKHFYKIVKNCYKITK